MLADLRLAVRSLRHAPTFTLAAVLTLALGIGATTAIFSIVYGVLLKPLPFAAPDRLISVVPLTQDLGLRLGMSQDDYEQWRQASTRLERHALYRENEVTVTGHGEPELANIALVSDDFFATLGTWPRIGRVLRARDAERPVAVIAHEFCRRRFGRAEDAVGATLMLDGRPHTVVGVMPPAFGFPARGIALWVPRLSMPGESETPRVRVYEMVGRMKAGVTLEQARAEATTIWTRIKGASRIAGPHIRVRRLQDDIVGSARTGVLLLLAVVVVVLLVACINVGSLCLARAAVRQGEIAIRTALGASRWRLVRHLLSEAILLAVAATAAGALLAAWLLAAGVRHVAPDTPRLSEVTLSLPVLAFAVGVGALTVMLVGLAPGWQAWRGSGSARGRRQKALAARLNGSGTRQIVRARRSRFALMAAETALSTLALIAALLFARSLGALLDVESGRPISNVLTVGLKLPAPAYANCLRDPDCTARAVSLVRDVTARVTRIPGVRSAAVTTSLPPHVSQMHFAAAMRNRETGQNEPYVYNLVVVSPEYFELLGIARLRGRFFDERDTATSEPVAIISRDVARRRYGREDVVGQPLPVPPQPRTIIGVVDDVRYGGLDQPAGGAFYTPYAQTPNPGMYLVVQTAGSPWSVATQVRDAVHAIDPRVPLGRPRTLAELRHASVAQPESRAILLGGLAVLALVLACVGLYGNSAYATSQRTFEVGVRMALGADDRRIFRMLVRGGLAPVALGLVVGLVAAAALSRLVASLLFGVRALDPLTFAACPALLLVVGAAAISLPALRACKADPAITLRRAP